MRIFAVALAIVLIPLGVGALWWGLSVVYIAIDPDAYRDSSESTYLVIGGLLSVVGITLLLAAGGLSLKALRYAMPGWFTLLVIVLAILPYPTLLGTSGLVINLLLLGVAAALVASRRTAKQAPIHGPSDTSSLE